MPHNDLDKKRREQKVPRLTSLTSQDQFLNLVFLGGLPEFDELSDSTNPYVFLSNVGMALFYYQFKVFTQSRLYNFPEC